MKKIKIKKDMIYIMVIMNFYDFLMIYIMVILIN